MFSVDRVDPLEALRRTKLFGDVPDEVLLGIAMQMHPRAYGAGHLLCTEGERGGAMYVLDEGQVEVVVQVGGEEKIEKLATLEPGAAFGMVSLVQDRPRMSSCVAKTRVVVLELDRQGWDALVSDPYLPGSSFRRAMIRVISDQLKFTNGQLAAFEERNAPPESLHEANAVYVRG
jgi:CRP-like cAMP-binding protein